jgi:hypothetical protein
MNNRTKVKIRGAAKITYGLVRGGMAISTGFGHGLLGGFLKNHHMTRHAGRLAKRQLDAAKETLDDGIKDWENA